MKTQVRSDPARHSMAICSAPSYYIYIVSAVAKLANYHFNAANFPRMLDTEAGHVYEFAEKL